MGLVMRVFSCERDDWRDVGIVGEIVVDDGLEDTVVASLTGGINIGYFTKFKTVIETGQRLEFGWVEILDELL
jgi:hypothetical protein